MLSLSLSLAELLDALTALITFGNFSWNNTGVKGTEKDLRGKNEAEGLTELW